MNSQDLYVRFGRWGRHLYTSAQHTAGETVCELRGTISHIPTKFTIQIDDTRHLVPEDEIWITANHSCNPSCFIDFASMRFIALRDIACNQEITFNYLTSEWELASPFQCTCGSESCFSAIAGYKFLSEDERRSLDPYAAPFLRCLAMQNGRGNSLRSQAGSR